LKILFRKTSLARYPAYHLYTHITDGATVVISISAGSTHSVVQGQTVYVEEIEVWYSESMDARYFTLTLRAA
jgi:hypothetical protein